MGCKANISVEQFFYEAAAAARREREADPEWMAAWDATRRELLSAGFDRELPPLPDDLFLYEGIPEISRIQCEMRLRPGAPTGGAHDDERLRAATYLVAEWLFHLDGPTRLLAANILLKAPMPGSASDRRFAQQSLRNAQVVRIRVLGSD